MGRSRLDSDDVVRSYAAFADTSRATTLSARLSGASADVARKQLFKQREIHSLFDPHQIVMRESRDSEFNPESRPIILGLDVTGSMGEIAERIATGQLLNIVKGIFEYKPFTDPHIMVMGIGDIYASDDAPLQVSQFEADASLLEQLKDLWLEGGGGGNQFESYDIPWYFAATRTSIDCFDKRGQKGFLFTIGDEPPAPADKMHDIQFIESRVGGNSGQTGQISTRDILEMAQEKYEVFHILCEQGNYCSYGRSKENAINLWTELLGKRLIRLDNYDNLAEVILAVIEVAEGAEPEVAINRRQDESVKRSIRYAFGM